MSVINGKRKPVLVHLTTVAQTLDYFFRDQLRYMMKNGFRVVAISSPGPRLDAFGRCEGVETIAVPMTRDITPGEDLRSLYKLVKTFSVLRPSIVHGHTPKAGLLAMIAASMCRVGARVYHVHGFPFETATGWKRQLLQWSERISCALADQVWAVSPSLRDMAISHGICDRNEIDVLLNGTINGLDVEKRFNPEHYSIVERQDFRQRYDIPDNALVVGFVGRVVMDKGIGDLLDAWRYLREDFEDLHLLVVGTKEEEFAPHYEQYLNEDRRIHLAGEIPVDDMGHVYNAIDVLAFPSHREGFGLAALEAASMGIPSVATKIVGCIDAVVDGYTGLLVPREDGVALAEALGCYLRDDDLRRRHGVNARQRAVQEFSQQLIWEAMRAGYRELLKAKKKI